MAEFGILELVLPVGKDAPEKPEAFLDVENQSLGGYAPGNGSMRFRFSPKAARVFQFTIRSNVPVLSGKTGSITAFTPEPDLAQQPASHLPNWWTDNPALEFADDVREGAHRVLGSKTVNRWREDYLNDFAERMDRCTG
jgi:hypothetical protein